MPEFDAFATVAQMHSDRSGVTRDDHHLTIEPSVDGCENLVLTSRDGHTNNGASAMVYRADELSQSRPR